MLSGVGTLVGFSSEATVRQYESGKDLPAFDQAFGVRCVLHVVKAPDVATLTWCVC